MASDERIPKTSGSGNRSLAVWLANQESVRDTEPVEPKQQKKKDGSMASKTTTKVGPDTYRETVRYNDGSGRSTTYKQGLVFRDVKSTTRWDGKGRKRN